MRMIGRKSTACRILMVFAVVFSSVLAQGAKVQLVHFTYSGHGERWQAWLGAIAKDFEAATGIGVRVEVSMSSGDYQPKLLTMVAGGVAPDVTDAHPMLAAPFIAQDIFEDLGPYIKRDKVPLERIPPAIVRGVQTPDGVMWGLPVSVYPVVTFFNADMFAEAGIANPIQLGENWTWETATTSAQRLTVDADRDGVPERYGLNAISARYEQQVHQAGGTLYDRLVYPTNSRFNTPPVQTALQWIQSLYVDRLASTSGNVQVYRGNAAFSVTEGPGFISAYYQDVPFSWDIAVQPKGPANRAARVNPDGFQILAASQHKDAAWKWIHFLTTSVDNQLELVRYTSRMPALREAMLRYPKVSTGKQPDNWYALVDTAFDPDGYAAYVIPNATVIDPVVNAVLNRIWRGEIAVATALEQIDQQVNALLRP
ncbi:MAG: ABC transporter substrate-binding protein [Limnochordia bacterium]|jgi:ABC-type glycerol-3-phosphate transport system substrate-binding protein